MPSPRRIPNYAHKLQEALATLELPEHFSFHVDTSASLDPTVHVTREYTVEGRPSTRYSSIRLLMNATDREALDRPQVVLEFAVVEFNAEASHPRFTDAAREAAGLSRDLLTAALATKAQR